MSLVCALCCFVRWEPRNSGVSIRVALESGNPIFLDIDCLYMIVFVYRTVQPCTSTIFSNRTNQGYIYGTQATVISILLTHFLRKCVNDVLSKISKSTPRDGLDRLLLEESYV